MKFISKNLVLEILFIVLLAPFIFTVFVLPNISYAADCVPPNTTDCTPVATSLPSDPNKAVGRIENPLGNTTSITALLGKLLGGLIYIAGPIIALAVVYCGFLFVSARGKPEAITKAKEALFYTLIGAAIILGAEVLSRLIEATVESLK